jgi:hypothetical protein
MEQRCSSQDATPKPNAPPFRFQAAPDARKQLDAPNLTGKRTKRKENKARPLQTPKERDQKTQETNKQTSIHTYKQTKGSSAAAALTWVSGGGRGSRGGRVRL